MKPIFKLSQAIPTDPQSETNPVAQPLNQQSYEKRYDRWSAEQGDKPTVPEQPNAGEQLDTGDIGVDDIDPETAEDEQMLEQLEDQLIGPADAQPSVVPPSQPNVDPMAKRNLFTL